MFSNDALLQSLNAIIHPAVKRAFQDWQTNLPSNTASGIREAAILFESSSHTDCDKVICVVAEDKLRIKRVLDRDHAKRVELEARIAKQMPQSEKAAKSDFIIDNNGQQSLIQQVLKIHKDLTTA